MQVLAFLIIALSVQEPFWDTTSFWVVDDVSDCVYLLLVEHSDSESWVNPQNFADQEAESSTHTLDLVKSKRHSPSSVDIGVEDTMDMLEVVFRVLNYQRHLCGKI